MIVSFNPGPSALYPFAEELFREATTSGILEISHRSANFIRLFCETQELLRDRLNVPANYAVYFLTSATEAWNVVLEGCVGHKSIHCFSGDFGKRWFDCARK
ncbi:MAG: aminotransferase class V-fold PLP-dependent enzyme, partial [Bacteroidia bacterium]|nr:aminotransferase class V-fold PLP-dependent enzyme [Bacteroidia bacterium]